MRILTYLLLSIPLLVFAQERKDASDTKGITFERALSWDQVLVKAKAENKYVFVDTHATWCLPCKWMDENVFSSEIVGIFMNERFISVRVQMDKTPRDSEEVKRWYTVARAFEAKHGIPGYPSYLFFSPDGELVHRGLGQKFEDDFISLARDAANPQKQFYKLLSEYKQGKRDTSVMKYLARTANQSGEKDFALEIADNYLRMVELERPFPNDDIAFLQQFQKNPEAQEILQDYKTSYLDKLDRDALCTRGNIYFISNFPQLVNSEGKFFALFQEDAQKVDSLYGEAGFSERMLVYVIRKEEINDKLYVGNAPISGEANWEEIISNIKQKYDSQYLILVPQSQVLFYKISGNWKTVAEIIEKKIREYPPKNEGKEFTRQVGGMFSDENTLNESAWDVFLRCDDKSVLEKAISWSKLSTQLHGPDHVNYPNGLDTRANLLYKLGRVKEAIALQERAIALDDANGKKAGRDKGLHFDGLNANLEKMRKGEPTWPVKKENN